ncbi:hypothetical protein I3F58_09950 [Streptomyces sp. MUM 203J]|uniref:hypothetical protein n=1 Tax=Streptomyces sp. MUM 203J TaxID=2791990 RepID=UPI001F047675|nr:hypothetical protein [Streptomyces sp. MUM 203J]MCH0539878.1 hypothetical protein [Streptomyces sp. MUM 203J]
MIAKRIFAALTALIALLGGGLTMAPTASAGSYGCGNTSNGQLCVRGGTLGKDGNYTFKVSYYRSPKAEITVKLGTQRKNSKITALVLWFGSKKTKNGYVELSKKHHLNANECIRGVMEYKGKTYVTKWRCP